MRVLVTGAKGFVGAHLCQGLRDYGWKVIETDKADAPLDEEGMASAVVRLADPDYVVHLAARYGRLLCRDKPHLAVQDNTAGTTELAAVCAERGTPVLYASSSEVYGDHGIEEITEDSELRMPTTIYGLSKRWGEEVLRLYMRPPKLCIVRMNMLYGPRQQAGYGRCALATFIENALTGQTVSVHRRASRSWLYIEDAVRALRMLIEGRHWGVYNLSNESERTTMTNLAHMVWDEVGELDFEEMDPPMGQIRHKNYSSRKLREAIDWKPEVNLRDGIAQTVAHERSRLEALQGDRAAAGT